MWHAHEARANRERTSHVHVARALIEPHSAHAASIARQLRRQLQRARVLSALEMRAARRPGRGAFPPLLTSQALARTFFATLPVWRFFMSAEPVMPLLLILPAARRMASVLASPSFCAAS